MKKIVDTFNKAKSIIFDFDGVLVESLSIKDDAFLNCLKDYPKSYVDEFLTYHRQNGGKSRLEKFNYFFKHILGKKVSEYEVLSLCQKFSDLVTNQVVQSPSVPGAEEVLSLLNARRTKVYIASGTPKIELDLILQARGMTDFFTKVLSINSDKSYRISRYPP